MNASDIAETIPQEARDPQVKTSRPRLRNLYRMLKSYNWSARELAMMEIEVKGEIEMWKSCVQSLP